MRALLLAAGRGERLHPLTARLPKPMIEIGNKPMLQWNVELLVAAGISDLAVNLHHEAAAIREHFGDGSAYGAHITYFDEPELLGTAGAVRNAASFFGSEDAIVVYADNRSNIDVRALIERHASTNADLTIALYRREDARSSGAATLDANDRITAFREKPARASAAGTWVNAGYLVVKPSFVQAIAPGAIDLGRDVIPRALETGQNVVGYRMTEELWWIDSIDDYRRAVAAHPDLRETHVLVTGASMGIGAVTARVCLEAGARVTICARGGTALEAACARLQTHAPTGFIQAVRADASQPEDVVRLFSEAEQRFGSVGAVVHAAAVLGPVGTILDVSPEEWRRTLEVDLFGAFLVAREACRRVPRPGGRVALFSGGGASAPYPEHSAYGCSKAAVVRLVETIAHEMQPHGIEINAVAPGLVATRMTAGRDTSAAVPPEVGARAAAFLVSQAARGITGKFVSAVHDDYSAWPQRLDALQNSDVFTLRRIVPHDRGLEWP